MGPTSSEPNGFDHDELLDTPEAPGVRDARRAGRRSLGYLLISACVLFLIVPAGEFAVISVAQNLDTEANQEEAKEEAAAKEEAKEEQTKYRSRLQQEWDDMDKEEVPYSDPSRLAHLRREQEWRNEVSGQRQFARIAT